LQERLQAQGRPLPSYRVSGEVGPDHRKMFHVEVFVGDEMIAQGTGRTKKEAEQEGAMRGLEAIRGSGVGEQESGSRDQGSGNSEQG
jgi:ribonuclease-3